MTRILGQSIVGPDAGLGWAASRGAPYAWASLAHICWAAGDFTGVRPEVMWAQACKETGFGKFGRAVTMEHCNPCGLKVPDPDGLPDDASDAHFRFSNWHVGFRAHAEHLALYAGAPGYPLPWKKVTPSTWIGATSDPRHFAFLLGRAGDNVEDLGGPGRWAPAPDYGDSIVTGYLHPMLEWANYVRQ